MRTSIYPIIADSNDLTAKWAKRSALALLRQVAVSPSHPLSPELPLHALVEQLHQAPGHFIRFHTFCIRLLYKKYVNYLRTIYDQSADHLRSAYSVRPAKSAGKMKP